MLAFHFRFGILMQKMTPPAKARYLPNGYDAKDDVFTAVDRLIRIEREVFQRRVSELKKLAGILRTGIPGATADNGESAFGSSQSRQLFSPVNVVRAVASRFTTNPFTFDELCVRVETEFPGLFSNRASISRRLFQLRVGKGAVIECVKVREDAGDFISPMKKKQRFYRYIGPP